MIVKLIVLCEILSMITVSNAITVGDKKYCLDLDPTFDFDVDQILGMYFVEEIIFHQRNDTKTERDYYCYQLHIRKPEDILVDGSIRQTTPSYYAVPTTPQYQYKLGPRGQHVPPEQRLHHLVLQWDEPGKVLDYHVKLNMSRRGFWISTAPQNAAYLPDMYNHFAGTIQVLKAVENHLVLSFCQRLPEPQLFTVILSRQLRQLTEVEIIEIHSLLTRKRLSTSAVKKVCTNAAVGFGTGLQSIALALLSSMLSRM